LACGRPITLVLGLVNDKDARAIANALTSLAARVIVTAPPSPRALPPASLRAFIPTAEMAPDAAAAFALARDGCSLVLVAGSIFLVGEARRLLTGEAADPVVVQDPLRASRACL
jgi:dihydrofolate synthase/folylpolyglutamate synthase